VRFDVGMSYSLLLLIAFESYSAGRQLLEAMFLKTIYLSGRCRWKILADLLLVKEEHGYPRTSKENVF
jgi:hypothetical protein